MHTAMDRKQFRAAAIGVLGAIVGALLAVRWVEQKVEAPVVDRAVPTAIDVPEPPDRMRPPLDPELEARRRELIVEGEAESDTGRPHVDNRLTHLRLQGTVRGAEAVVQLPYEGWTLNRFSGAADWPGRATDLLVQGNDVVFVHTDGKRSQLFRCTTEGPGPVHGGASGTSPFLVGDRLHWLRNRELVRTNDEGSEVVLTAPALSHPAPSSSGYSLVVGKGLEFFTAEGSALHRLDLPEELGEGAWFKDELVFTRFTVGDADLWSFQNGVLTPRVDSEQAEMRPVADDEGVLWYVLEDQPGVYDLVRGTQVVAEGVALGTRRGPDIHGTRAVVSAAEPGTLLLVSSDELTEVVTGLPTATDPVWLNDGTLAFASGPDLVTLELGPLVRGEAVEGVAKN
jgi:hypothetical protein